MEKTLNFQKKFNENLDENKKTLLKNAELELKELKLNIYIFWNDEGQFFIPENIIEEAKSINTIAKVKKYSMKNKDLTELFKDVEYSKVTNTTNLTKIGVFEKYQDKINFLLEKNYEFTMKAFISIELGLDFERTEDLWNTKNKKNIELIDIQRFFTNTSSNNEDEVQEKNEENKKQEDSNNEDIEKENSGNEDTKNIVEKSNRSLLERLRKTKRYVEEQE